MPELPGDLLLDRYLPDATNEERSEARQNLCAFAKAMKNLGAEHRNYRWQIEALSDDV